MKVSGKDESMSHKALPKYETCPAVVTIIEQSLKSETTVLDLSLIVENLEHMRSRLIILSRQLLVLR